MKQKIREFNRMFDGREYGLLNKTYWDSSINKWYAYLMTKDQATKLSAELKDIGYGVRKIKQKEGYLVYVTGFIMKYPTPRDKRLRKRKSQKI